jgi:hypothetical protein
VFLGSRYLPDNMKKAMQSISVEKFNFLQRRHSHVIHGGRFRKEEESYSGIR